MKLAPSVIGARDKLARDELRLDGLTGHPGAENAVAERQEIEDDR